MAKWQRDTWQPAQAVASVNGVMPSDYQMMLPPGTVPQVQQGMPSLPNLSFPRGGGAPQSLPVGDIERTAGKPRPAPARAADRRTTTTRGEGEKGGENRVIPGMAKGSGRIDTPKGEGLDYQRQDKERVAGMLDREREPEAQRNAPSAPRRGTQEKRESNKRVYLPSPQLITGNLSDDAEGTSLEQFAMPGAGDMEALMPLLMMMMMSGQGPGMGMPQGMPMGQPGMQGPPMGAMPPMGGQSMPPMPPGMPGMGAGMPPGMHMMPDGMMMPDDKMQGAPSWAGRAW